MPIWQAAVTMFSLIVALGSALFTGMQWYERHSQFLASMKPHLNFITDNDPDLPPVGIAIADAGSATAVIKSVTFFVDRKTVRDANEAATHAKLSSTEFGYDEIEPGDTVAPGEKIWLIKYRKPRVNKIDKQTAERFADFVEQNLAIEVVFCSAIRGNFCWTRCSANDRCR